MFTLCIIAIVVGGIMFSACVRELLKEVEDVSRFSSNKAVVAASLGAICFMFLFGLIVAPFDKGAWMTPWDFLLILGLLPIIFVVRSLKVDIDAQKIKEEEDLVLIDTNLRQPK